MSDVEALVDEVRRLRHQLFLSDNVVNAARVLVEGSYDRRLNDYKAAFGKLERAVLVYDDLGPERRHREPIAPS